MRQQQREMREEYHFKTVLTFHKNGKEAKDDSFQEDRQVAKEVEGLWHLPIEASILLVEHQSEANLTFLYV